MLTARGAARSAGNENLPARKRTWVDPESGETFELELTTREHEDMKLNKEHAPAAQQYAAAYAKHYSEKDLSAALRSYHHLVTTHPDAPEAECARTQIRNIAKSVIPAPQLLAAELELALRCLRPGSDLLATASS